VGALYRRTLRRYLQKHGVSYREEKSWLDSQFVIQSERSHFDRIRDWIDRINEEDEI
tara:strand:- start:702 stop:872 length:171 start_codon:yes stop_codon:yes gene_type:complete